MVAVQPRRLPGMEFATPSITFSISAGISDPACARELSVARFFLQAIMAVAVLAGMALLGGSRAHAGFISLAEPTAISSSMGANSFNYLAASPQKLGEERPSSPREWAFHHDL